MSGSGRLLLIGGCIFGCAALAGLVVGLASGANGNFRTTDVIGAVGLGGTMGIALATAMAWRTRPLTR